MGVRNDLFCLSKYHLGSIRMTNLKQAPVPPPMCHFSTSSKVETPLAMSQSSNRIAVVSSDSNVIATCNSV